MTYVHAAICVWSIGLGVLIRDVAQDYRDEKTAKVLAQCEQYAKQLSQLLTNDGRLTAPGTVVSCKAKHIQVNS